MTHAEPVRVNPDGSDRDDWDEHWDRFGESSKGSPANSYRKILLRRLLGPVPAGGVLLDIGSGQGQFALDYAEDHRDVHVLGVEASHEGVSRANAAARRQGLDARFIVKDLLAEPVTLDDGQPPATHAICSEVLEHVAEPVRLMRNSLALLAPGARVVVTVPGGPQSAFDKHIGHYRHYTTDALNAVLVAAGLEVDRLYRAGFPFFNLFKVAAIIRGDRLVRDLDRDAGTPPPRLEAVASAFFRSTARLNLDHFPVGWQIAAVGHVPTTPC